MDIIWLFLTSLAMALEAPSPIVAYDNSRQQDTSMDTEFRLNATNSENFGVATTDPITFGPNFFFNIGRPTLVKIDIIDRYIQTIDRAAFENLDQLRGVVLTNVSLLSIDPDTFADNKNLHHLTLAYNDFHAMENEIYMIKSPSIEYLDISYCNLSELLATTFNEMPKLLCINLEGNKLKTLPVETFSKVKSIQEIILSFNAIEVLPSAIFDGTNLTSLILTGNKISKNIDFGTPNVRIIDLSQNQINYVENDAFRSMPGLTDLHLSGNSIRKVQENALSSLINLNYIDLSANKLEHVSSLIFKTNERLSIVLISDNQKLKSLPTDGFKIENGTSGVTSFDATNCDLTELTENMFTVWPMLLKLHLSLNSIRSLPNQIFSICQNLVDIDLSRNLLTHLDDSLFSQNFKLEKLNLAFNPLKTLSAKTFAPLRNLIELHANECDLVTVFAESGTSITKSTILLESLKVLDLSNNLITRILLKDVMAMNSLEFLSVSNNSLLCDENFIALMYWLSSKEIISSSYRDETVTLSCNLGASQNTNEGHDAKGENSEDEKSSSSLLHSEDEESVDEENRDEETEDDEETPEIDGQWSEISKFYEHQ